MSERLPVSEHRLARRVQFYETDAAGVVHFSDYFRYMEEAEHALWRAAGLSIHGSARRSAGRACTRPSTTTARCASRRSSRRTSGSSRSRSARSATCACCRARASESRPAASRSPASRTRPDATWRAVAIPPEVRARLAVARPRTRRAPRAARERRGQPPTEESLEREALAALQGRRLSELVAEIDGRNAFYTRKLRAAGVRAASLRFPRDLDQLPFTTKAELVADQEQNPPWGTALSEPLERYTRYCQTSSTTGRPLKWLDTNESWQWVLDCWKAVYRGARVGPDDRIFFPFSFGPFLGFWAAFDAASQVGALSVPGGGMSSQMRLSLATAVEASVVCCTPTYALHLAEVAAAEGLALHDGAVRVLIVAGEPGGNVPATRQRIEAAWGARVIDHHGLTEVGPVSFECWEAPGFLHLNESRFLCEVLDPASLEAGAGRRARRAGGDEPRPQRGPVLRYRTRDVVVRRSEPCPCGRSWARLEGGIVARDDDMVNVRGVNVYPTAIEAVLRDFHEIVEFRSTISRSHEMRALSLEIEPIAGLKDASALAAAVARRLREALGLSVPVRVVAPQGLPRFEMKARRFVLEDEKK